MNLKQDEIVSIEPMGYGETADIEIIDADGEHQQNYFLGNGINVHNSGAMNQYPAYKFNKVKKSSLENDHPIIKKWTKNTYGLIIYQEQVMQIVRELGGFSWAQTNTVRKVMSKSGGAEYFMKTFWPTWKENCEKHGMDEKEAKRAFHKIMSFGSWAFNLTISGDTKILNTNPNQYAPKWITIKQLYEQEGYATNKWRSQPDCYVKMNTLSMDSDGNLRPAKIKNVFYHGKVKLWEVVTESGRKIELTERHRLMGIEGGEETFIRGEDIDIGTVLLLNDGYQKKDNRTGAGKGWAKNYKGHLSDKHKPYIDGRSIEKNEFRAKMLSLQKPCQRCGEDYHKDLSFEAHHYTRNPPHSKFRWLCNRCHKIEEYELGNRVKLWAKGFPVVPEKVISKKYMGIKDGYDIEMEDDSRPTFVANGFVSHNSHSVSYAMVSYVSMWFKIHYPLQFVTAYLNAVNDSGGDKKQAMIKESLRMKIVMREPSVNVSKSKFVIHGEAIVAGLIDIKNVGQKAVDTIVENQPYKGILSFLKKVDNRACNKRSVENLIKAGAFDEFHYNKKALLENIEEINKNMKKNNAVGLSKAKELVRLCKGKEEYTKQEITELKTAVSPIAIGKHITEYYSDVISKLGKHISLIKLEDIELDDAAQVKMKTGNTKKRVVAVVGLLTKVDLKRLSQEVKEVIDVTAEKRYALANLEDGTDFCVLTFREEVYERYEQKLHDMRGKVLLVSGYVNVGWKKIYVDRVFLMNDLREMLKNNAEAGDWHTKYLFQHPVERAFGSEYKLKQVRLKYGAEPMKKVILDKGLTSRWIIGIITSIKTFKIKRGDSAGKEMHIVQFEDDTFCGSFVVFPTDTRYRMMKEDLFELQTDKRPFMLKMQRDYKMDTTDLDTIQVSLSIDKRAKWKDCIRKPFKFKEA